MQKATTLLTGLILAAAASTASATVFFNNQFETEVPNSDWHTPNVGYSAGKAPVTLGSYNLAGGMTLPTAANNRDTAGGRGATVFAAGTAGFATQAVGVYSHPAQWANDEGQVMVEHGPSQDDPLTGTDAGQYVFSFDFSTNTTAIDTSAWTVKPGIELRSSYFAYRTQPEWWLNGGNLALLSVSQSMDKLILNSAEGATEIATGITASTPYHIAATVNMDNATFTIAVNGAPVGGTFTQLVPENWNKGIGEYLARGGQDNDTSSDGMFYFYDNIQLATVPEPATLSLLGLAAAAVLTRRSRKA